MQSSKSNEQNKYNNQMNKINTTIKWTKSMQQSNEQKEYGYKDVNDFNTDASHAIVISSHAASLW